MLKDKITQNWATIHFGSWLLCSPVLLFTTWQPWLTAVLLLFLLALRLLTKRLTGGFFSATLIDPLIAIYLFLAGIALWASPMPQYSISYFVNFLTGVFGYYATTDWLSTTSRQRLLLMALAIGGSTVALLGFFTLEWPSRYIVNMHFITDKLPRLSNKFTIHHNEMAGLMLLLLPMALFLPRQNQKERILLMATAVIMATMLLFTQSRNAWFALLISYLAYKVWGRFHTRYLIILVFLWLLLPLAFVMLPTSPQQNLTEQISLLDAATKENIAAGQSWATRLEIWSSAGQTIRDYPIIGAGWSTFALVGRLNYVYDITPATFHISHAHNLLLQTAANTGLAGLITAIILWLTTIGHLWRRPDEPNSHLTAVLGASFMAYLCFNAFDVLALEQKPGIVIWLLLATAMTAVPIKKPFPRALPLIPLLLWMLLLFTPMLSRNIAYLQLDKARLENGAAQIDVASLTNDKRRMGMAYWLMDEQEKALTQWQADENASQFLVGQGQQAFMAEAWQTAVSWHTAALTVNPMNGLACYERGRAYESAHMPTHALADYEQATVLIPAAHPEQQAKAWAGLGRLLVHTDEWEQAAFAFAQANSLVPNSPDYQQQLKDVNQMLKEMGLQP